MKNFENIPEPNEPKRKISYNLIKEILSFLPLKMNVQNYLTLNKKFYELINFKAKRIQFEKKEEMKIKSFFNFNLNEIIPNEKVYYEFNINEIKEENKIGNSKISNINLKISKKDLKWSTIIIGWTHIDLRIIDSKTKEILKIFKDIYNLNKLKKILRGDNGINLNDKEYFEGFDIIELLNKKLCLVQIVGISSNPGSICHIISMTAKIDFYSINY